VVNQTGEISYITHDAPAWRPTNSYIAMVDLAPFGFENEQEQLWLRPLAGDEFEVCCIPFRVYGVALGDRVNIRNGRFVSNVVSSSGRRVFRVFFTDPRPHRRAWTRVITSVWLSLPEVFLLSGVGIGTWQSIFRSQQTLCNSLLQ
jgi:hypothetical protein